MMTNNASGAPSMVQRFLARLDPRQLVWVLAILFVLDLFIPDALPFVDEIALGILTLLAARWKNRQGAMRKPPMKDVTPRH